MAEEKESASKEKPKAESSATGTQAAPGGNKIVFWMVIAGILIAEIPIMYVVVKMTRPKEQNQSAAERQADSLKTVSEHAAEIGATSEKPIEAIVNVPGTDGERFLKVVISLEYKSADPEKKEKKSGHGEGAAPKSRIAEEIDKRNPKIKNMLIDILSSPQYTLQALNEPEAKNRIREQLRKRINESLPPGIGEVSEVYIEQFIIQ